MNVCFLGTGGSQPTARRNQSGVLLRRKGERFLFDCGEGTQKQMMRFGTGFSISHIFITRFQQDHILGIPGLLHTFDYNNRENPLRIYVPEGKRTQTSNLAGITQVSMSFSIYVHEVSPGSTVVREDGYRVGSFPTTCSEPSVGYVLYEPDRRGRFNREKAEHELGIPAGPMYGQLCSGESVELEDGRVIDPDQVLGPPRPGRRIVYTGDTRPSDAVVEAAEDADLLIHDAAFEGSHVDRAEQTGHSIAAEAGRVASQADAKRLALFHFAPRYQSNAGHLQEAEEVVDSTEIMAPDDGFSIDIPYPETPEQSDTGSASSKQNQSPASDEAGDSTQSTTTTTPEQTADGGTAAASIDKIVPEKSTVELSEAREQAEAEAREEVEVSTASTTQRSSEYSRSAAIKRYVKKRANGYCEGCQEPAPFMSKTGKPYLHAHHVFELSDGGSDTPDTVIALCPNCHFRVHHGEDGEEYNRKLHKKLQQIEDRLNES
jgi:ribonuclease Z